MTEPASGEVYDWKSATFRIGGRVIDMSYYESPRRWAR